MSRCAASLVGLVALGALKTGCLVGAGVATAAAAEYRVATGGEPFVDTHQLAVALDVTGPSRWGIDHFELGVGGLISQPRFTPFVSLGPVWRYELDALPLYVAGSMCPTLIGRGRFRDQALGGHVYFTSAVSVGWRLDRGASLALRLQHASNAGLHRPNPGLDMIGLSFRLAPR